MKKLFTIGTQGLTNSRFAALLEQHDIDGVIDVRLRTEGPRYRFASGRNIRRVVEEGGRVYLHERRFGSTPELLRAYLTNRDWDAFAESYAKLIQTRDMDSVWEAVAGSFDRPLLLGVEKTPGQCHCRLLGEHFARRLDVEVVHLREGRCA